jgi:hypothetical protein
VTATAARWRADALDALDRLWAWLHRAGGVVRATTAFDRAAERGGPPPPEPPPDQLRARRTVTFAVRSAGDVHARLRPELAEVVASRLAVGHGLDLAADPGAAERLVGPELWELVRPDRQPPDDSFAPGLPLARIEALLDQVEAL